MKYFKNILLPIFAITLIIFVWSLVVPVFEFPDEQAHFGSVEFLLSNGRVPVGNEEDMTPEMKGTQEYLGIYRNDQGQNKYTYHPEFLLDYSDTYLGPHELEIIALNTPDLRSSYVATEAARYPRAYYDYESFFLRLVNNQDIITRLFVSRLGSLLISALLALFVFKIGKLIFRSQSLALTLAVMVMLQPMMSFVTAGINSDNLHNLFFTMMIYFSLCFITNKPSLTDLVLGSFVVVADIYTKPQGIIALPLFLLAMLIYLVKKRSWKAIFAMFGVIGLVLLLGRSQITPYLGIINSANSRGVSFIEYLRFSGNKLIAQNTVWYWGVFKWLGVVLPPIYWRVANRVVLLSALGIIVYLVKVFRKKKVIIPLLSVSYLFFSIVLYSLAIYYFDWHYTKNVGYSIGVQARYFYPTIVAQMALLLTGIISLGWGLKSLLWLRRFLLLLFLWLQLGGLWRLITSYYDISSISTFITQISQYKPFFAKGPWWYLWALCYLFSIIIIIRQVWGRHARRSSK